MRVQLVHAWPERYWSLELELPPGATAAEAISEAGAELESVGIDLREIALAVFGRSVEARAVLRDGDRLELLRPLQVSPQQARAARAAAARRTGKK